MFKGIRLIVPFVLLSVLYLAACGVVLAAPVPLLKIDEPLDGMVIESYVVNLDFSLKNFSFKDFKPGPRNNPNQGHLHLWLDAEEKTPDNAVKYFKDSPYTFADVLSGKHTLVVELVNNDHTSFDPQIIQTIKFETKAPAGSEAAPVKAQDQPPAGSSLANKGALGTGSPVFLRTNLYYLLGLAALVFGLAGLLILRR